MVKQVCFTVTVLLCLLLKPTRTDSSRKTEGQFVEGIANVPCSKQFPRNYDPNWSGTGASVPNSEQYDISDGDLEKVEENEAILDSMNDCLCGVRCSCPLSCACRQRKALRSPSLGPAPPYFLNRLALDKPAPVYNEGLLAVNNLRNPSADSSLGTGFNTLQAAYHPPLHDNTNTADNAQGLERLNTADVANTNQEQVDRQELSENTKKAQLENTVDQERNAESGKNAAISANTEDFREDSNVELSNGQNEELSESGNEGLSESQNGSSENQNEGLPENQNEGFLESQNGGLSEIQNEALSESQNKALSESQNEALSDSENEVSSEKQHVGLSESQNTELTRDGSDNIEHTEDLRNANIASLTEEIKDTENAQGRANENPSDMDAGLTESENVDENSNGNHAVGENTEDLVDIGKNIDVSDARLVDNVQMTDMDDIMGNDAPINTLEALSVKKDTVPTYDETVRLANGAPQDNANRFDISSQENKDTIYKNVNMEAPDVMNTDSSKLSDGNVQAVKTVAFKIAIPIKPSELPSKLPEVKRQTSANTWTNSGANTRTNSGANTAQIESADSNKEDSVDDPTADNLGSSRLDEPATINQGKMQSKKKLQDIGPLISKLQDVNSKDSESSRIKSNGFVDDYNEEIRSKRDLLDTMESIEPREETRQDYI